ncbi:hypothetical protein EGR_02184 [Echinococcus granulosus]|uniref:Uncharacterized protein n=1 Tax=Echinococcus granulosus TaxID=6210 RepID=W6UNB6_ECHGR|nr:hypothetical protein EGR_02184 [Echinococcus granulosus]EUB63090.1 hypothetical protein EGR_02184 [Echinococcus granulosus]
MQINLRQETEEKMNPLKISILAYWFFSFKLFEGLNSVLGLYFPVRIRDIKNTDLLNHTRNIRSNALIINLLLVLLQFDSSNNYKLKYQVCDIIIYFDANLNLNIKSPIHVTSGFDRCFLLIYYLNCKSTKKCNLKSRHNVIYFIIFDGMFLGSTL